MLTDKRILIFGGSGLIGSAVTAAIVRNNGSAIVASRTRNEAVFEHLEKDLQQKIQFTEVDISNEKSIAPLLDKSHQEFGAIDAVVNCAFPRADGFGDRFQDVTFENFCNNMNTHLGGAFLVCQNAAKYFESRGGGRIINFASIYGFLNPRFEIYDGTSMTKEIEYVLSKSAIIQLTSYLAKYYRGKNIYVNCISPGGIENGEDELFIERYNKHCLNKGMLDSEDITGTVIFLLSEGAQYLNGQNIVIDDGFSL